MTTVKTIDPELLQYVEDLLVKSEDSKEHAILSGGEYDLIIGKNVNKFFSVDNDRGLKIKNIFVFGRLAFNPKFPIGNGCPSPKVVVRNIYVIGNGKLDVFYVTLECLNRQTFDNKEAFRNALLSSPKEKIF
ncbi:MAG: hypothetical protein L0207_04885 [Chlamydiae bacterium]|nr:hypothetical protein [Chlamydiota bacterium]